eukprot:1977021-Pleurochrysis_carterae.AAC.1
MPSPLLLFAECSKVASTAARSVALPPPPLAAWRRLRCRSRRGVTSTAAKSVAKSPLPLLAGAASDTAVDFDAVAQRGSAANAAASGAQSMPLLAERSQSGCSQSHRRI